MKILHIISSPRGASSYSVKLGIEILNELKIKYPDSIVKTRNLSKVPFPHLDEEHLNSFMTKAENRTPEQIAATALSDEAILELIEADIIVIGVPMYNFGINSTLKAWLDHIIRPGLTFSYSENGPVGLVGNKKVYLAISSGGIYSKGPMKPYDFTEPYLTKALNFIGITDITTYRVEGVAIPTLQDHVLEKAVEKIAV